MKNNDSLPQIPDVIKQITVTQDEEKYKLLIENSLSAFLLTIPDGTILEVNKAATNMFGYSPNEFKTITRQQIIDHNDHNFKIALKQRENNGYARVEATGIKKNGDRFPIKIYSSVFTNAEGELRTSTLINDITETRHLRELDRIEKEVLEKNTRTNSKIEKTLSFYLKEIEKLHPGMLCSILKLKGNKLFNWSSDSLPENFCTAIEGITIGENVGSCGTAVFKKEKVIVTDIENDVKWANYKQFALKDGLLSCWSYPIINSRNKVLGTFAIYYNKKKSPSKEEEKTIERATNILAIILENKMTDAALLKSNERFDLLAKTSDNLLWECDLLTGNIYRTELGLAKVYGHSSNKKIKTFETWSNFLHPQDKDRVLGVIQKSIQSEKETYFQCEYRFKKEDGTYVYINDHGYIIRNEKGVAVRIFGAAEDISQRKENEKTIKESEQRYKMFVQNSTEGIWRIELNEAIHISTPVEEMIDYCYNNAFIAECNDTFAKMYAYKNAKEMIGISLKELMPADNQENMDYLSKFFKDGFKISGAISYETDKEGREVILLNNMIGIVEDNYLKRTWGIQRNITEQVKTEKALKESENRLRTIVETEPECIKILNEQGELLEMNPAGLAMIEADNLQQVMGNKISTILFPRYIDAFNKLIKDVFNGKSKKLEFEITGLKGTIRWLETHAVPLKNDNKEIYALLGVTRDITENKRTEALLKTTLERYRDLFNNNPSTIIIWDFDDLKIIEANETAIQLYGYTKEEMYQLNVLEFRPKEDYNDFLEFAGEIRKKGFTNNTIRRHHITKTGTHIIMEITSHTIIYNGKKAVLALGNNVTEKVQLENSLMEERKIRQQQITDAVITGQEKERLEIGQELHDNINQILATTKLYLDCALVQKDFSAKLINESKMLTEKAMLEIRRLSNSLIPPSLEEIGLLEALNDLAANIKEVNPLRIIISMKDITEDELNKKIKLTIFRIVQEQLNNILKHANAKQVKISITKQEEQIFLSIKDDGIGFDTTQKRNGVGLKNIISRSEVNGGKVIIQSDSGEGCLLSVVFN